MRKIFFQINAIPAESCFRRDALSIRMGRGTRAGKRRVNGAAVISADNAMMRSRQDRRKNGRFSTRQESSCRYYLTPDPEQVTACDAFCLTFDDAMRYLSFFTFPKIYLRATDILSRGRNPGDNCESIQCGSR